MDREALLAFYDLPAEHRDHLRTADPIESIFVTVRHRTVRTKGPWHGVEGTGVAVRPRKPRNGSPDGLQTHPGGFERWRRLKGANQLPMLIEGVRFTDGVTETDAANCAA